MTTTAEFQNHNALLDDPQAMRGQMATDGFLFFRGLLPADEIVALRRKILQVCDNYGWIAPGTELMDGIADPRRMGWSHSAASACRLKPTATCSAWNPSTASRTIRP